MEVVGQVQLEVVMEGQLEVRTVDWRVDLVLSSGEVRVGGDDDCDDNEDNDVDEDDGDVDDALDKNDIDGEIDGEDEDNNVDFDNDVNIRMVLILLMTIMKIQLKTEGWTY